MKLSFHEYGIGFPLLILHGLFGSSDNWHTLSRKFADHFRVLAIDLRNHGRSPHDNIHSYESMAEDLVELCHDQDISSTYVIGHSMGGKAAMELALHHSNLVSKLIAVDIGPKQYSPHHDSIFEALFSVNLKESQSRNDVELSLAKTVGSPVTRQFLMKNLRRTETGLEWKINLEAIRSSYDEVNRAITGPPFPNPALFVRSLTSGYVSDDDIPQIKSLFPLARVTDLNVGHWIHAEAPDDFLRLTLDFLGRGS